MNWIKRIARLVEDPPPEFVFEVSDGAIAWARRTPSWQTGLAPLAEGVVQASPLADNVLQPEVFGAQIRALATANGSRKRRPAALILPDFCARIAVLDFDALPSNSEEQATLVRFRAKKTVPFDIDTAALSYHVQPRHGSKRYDVVVAVVSLEILAHYEAAVRGAGLQPGLVTTSTLAAMNLVRADGLTVLVKACGTTLTATLLQGSSLRLLRCVGLSEMSVREVLGVLHPTFAFAEDELGGRPATLHACGFGPVGDDLRVAAENELGVRFEPVRSRLGAPSQNNAGLLGYLESVEG